MTKGREKGVWRQVFLQPTLAQLTVAYLLYQDALWKVPLWYLKRREGILPVQKSIHQLRIAVQTPNNNAVQDFEDDPEKVVVDLQLLGLDLCLTAFRCPLAEADIPAPYQLYYSCRLEIFVLPM